MEHLKSVVEDTRKLVADNTMLAQCNNGLTERNERMTRKMIDFLMHLSSKQEEIEKIQIIQGKLIEEITKKLDEKKG